MTGISDEAIAATILARVAERRGRNVEPTQVARALAGSDPEAWSRLMPQVRRVAVQLMKQDRIVITRRGRVVDPDDFRGTYRLAEPSSA